MTAERRVPPPPVEVADYPHRLAGHCGSGALRDLLEWAGLSWGEQPLSEGSVFGLGGALGFHYLRGDGLGTPFYLVGRTSNLTTDLCSRLGVATHAASTDDPVLGWDRVRGELEAGRPVLCWADMSELPYLRVRMRMSRHDIVVIAHHPATDEVVVVDNDRPEPQRIPAAALAAARSSTGFPAPTRHTCYPMRFPEALPDRRAAAAEACAQAVVAMTRPDPADAVGVPHARVRASGLDGVSAFIDDLATWPETLPTDGPGDDQALHTALLTLAVFIEKAGTGGGLFRRLQAEFLADLVDLGPRARIAADAFHALAAQWTAVAAGAAADPDPATAIRRWESVRDGARRLPVLEAQGIEALRDLAEHLDPAGSDRPGLAVGSGAPTEP